MDFTAREITDSWPHTSTLNASVYKGFVVPGSENAEMI